MIELEGIDPLFHEDVAALAQDMRVHGYHRDAPVREIFALMGDRWSNLLLLVLGFGVWRHAELRRVLGRLGAEGKISQRVLTLKLRALERDGLVIRHVTGDVPPKVSYELSALGKGLLGEVKPLIGWINRHRAEIDDARRDYARERGTG
jgi:DNA-binding HxlR family transcriptional regulator